MPPKPPARPPSSKRPDSRPWLLAYIALAILPLAWALVVVITKIIERRRRANSPSGESGIELRDLPADSRPRKFPWLEAVRVTEPERAVMHGGRGGVGVGGDRGSVGSGEWERRGSDIARMRSGEHVCVVVKTPRERGFRGSQESSVRRDSDSFEDVGLGPSPVEPRNMI